MKLRATITPAEEVLAVAPDGTRDVLGIILRHSGTLWPECRQEGCSWKDPFGPRHEQEEARAAVLRHYYVDHLV